MFLMGVFVRVFRLRLKSGIREVSHQAGMFPWLFFLTLVFLPACTAQASDPPSQVFPVRALHLSLRPQLISLEQYRQRIDQAAKLHYNMLILHTGGVYLAAYEVPEPGTIKFHNATHEQIAQLLVYARKAGLEPVFEVKAIAKHVAIMSKELLKKYPGLITRHAKRRNGVLNAAYRFPDGRDAYDVIEMPMLDNMIALYGKTRPRYLLLGIDEVPVDDLASAAKALNTTPPQLFAKLINRCVDHLLAQGITPIVWGDMFLSNKLSRPGHGVKGFTSDPRMIDGNASYLNHSPTAPSTLTAMNDLKNRDKIIIADWHYDTGVDDAFPSVDYFQTMGFKDVWGATWYNDNGIRLFSSYAAKRGCGGMIATTWNMSFSPSVLHNLPPILNNSSFYFRHPAYKPVDNPIVSFWLADSDKSSSPSMKKYGGVFNKQTRRLAYTAILDPRIVPQNAVLMIRKERTQKQAAWTTFPLRFHAEDHRLTGHVTLPPKRRKLPEAYSMILRFLDQDGYMVQRFYGKYIHITQRRPAVAGKAMSGVLFAADFSRLTSLDLQPKIFFATGQYPVLMQMIDVQPQTAMATKTPAVGVLDCQKNGAWSMVPGLWKQIARGGMRMEITFKLTSEIPAHRKNYAALVSMGTYNSGMRLLLTRERTLLLQFARQDPTRLPIWITSSEKLALNQWQTVRVTLTPPVAGKTRQVTLQINQNQAVLADLPNPVSPYNNDAPLGLGVEFKRFSNNSKQTWPLLPAQIRRVQIKPY